jgi:hypothetical protein
MSGYRISPVAEGQLDDIWLRIARESGSIDTADASFRASVTASGRSDSIRAWDEADRIYRLISEASLRAITLFCTR